MTIQTYETNNFVIKCNCIEKNATKNGVKYMENPRKTGLGGRRKSNSTHIPINCPHLDKIHRVYQMTDHKNKKKSTRPLHNEFIAN